MCNCNGTRVVHHYHGHGIYGIGPCLCNHIDIEQYREEIFSLMTDKERVAELRRELDCLDMSSQVG